MSRSFRIAAQRSGWAGIAQRAGQEKKVSRSSTRITSEISPHQIKAPMLFASPAVFTGFTGFPVRSFRSGHGPSRPPGPRLRQPGIRRSSGRGTKRVVSIVPPPGIHRVAKRMRRIFRIHKEPVLCLYFPDQSTENSTTRYSRSTTSGVRVKVYSGPLPTVNQPRSSPSLASHTMRQFSSTPDTRAARVTASP